MIMAKKKFYSKREQTTRERVDGCLMTIGPDRSREPQGPQFACLSPSLAALHLRFLIGQGNRLFSDVIMQAEVEVSYLLCLLQSGQRSFHFSATLTTQR